MVGWIGDVSLRAVKPDFPTLVSIPARTPERKGKLGGGEIVGASA
jgi:hypothetical protein